MNPASRTTSPASGAPRRLAVALALSAAIVVSGTAGAATSTSEPIETKADLLYNVAKFIEWPAPGPGAPPLEEFTFAIIGEDALAGALAASWSTKTVNGLPVFVRCVRRPQDARDSHMLFVAATEEKRIPEILAAMEGTNVLTVADVPSFAAAGGMVAFVIENGKVQFEINPAPARRAGLKISARLLALARIVDPRVMKP